MDISVDAAGAVVAVVSGVVAVAAGIERWLSPARRARQYALLTTMRDDEQASDERREAMEAARTRTAAAQLGSFWVPAYRFLTFLPVVAAVVVVTVVATARADEAGKWLFWTAVSFALCTGAWWRFVYWLGARRYLTAKYLSGVKVTAADFALTRHGKGVVLLLGWLSSTEAAVTGWVWRQDSMGLWPEDPSDTFLSDVANTYLLLSLVGVPMLLWMLALERANLEPLPPLALGNEVPASWGSADGAEDHRSSQQA